MKARIAVAILAVWIATPALAGNQTPYSMQISIVAPDHNKLPPLIKISLRNNTFDQLVVPSTGIVPIDYIVSLVDASTGLLVEKTEKGKYYSEEGGSLGPSPPGTAWAPLSYEVGGMGLQPNESHDETFDLSTLYDLRNGRYIMVVRHRFPIVRGDQALYSSQLEFTVQ